MESLQITRLTALGHPGRMALFRLLVRRYPEYLAAGEIAQVLDVKNNTLSVYLSALVRAGLLEQRRAGRNVLYRSDMTGAENLVAYLFEDCCRARPDLCTSDPAAAPRIQGHTGVDAPYNVLFICTGNSARSIFAETLLRDCGGDRFNVFSAGTHPSRSVNPTAIGILRDKGRDVSHLRAKHVSEFQGADAPVMDFVLTVCDQAANEDCPAWTGQPVFAHWGVPDPVRPTGTVAEKQRAFQHAYELLKSRITAFAALRPESLDRVALQSRLDDISLIGDTQ